jgi:hypothetical protein
MGSHIVLDNDVVLMLLSYCPQVCSYVACRNGGVKFRYCAHCMAPVAKRNFCRRHDHGMSGTPGLGAVKDSEDEEDEELDESELSGDQSGWSGTQTAPAGEKRKRSNLEKNGEGSASNLEIEGSSHKRKKNGSLVSTRRRLLWSSLLAKRPRTKDPRNLSSWLNEVLTVSDLDFPVDANSPTGVASALEPAGLKPKGLGSKARKSVKPNAATGGGQSQENIPREGGTKDKSRQESKDRDKSFFGTKSNRSNPDIQSSLSSGETESSQDNKEASKEDDGFAGSFADWRGRKKITKKASSSLRK